MNKDIKISIIVSAYNVGSLLGRCLDSLLEQTYKNIEIIVIDDGSTDETGNILDDYVLKDNRIIPIHQENKGLVAVRERGIDISSGRYIGFVDGDDTVTSDMFERLLNNAIKYKAEISHCGMLYCFDDGRRKPMHGTGKVQEMGNIEGQVELLKGQLFEPSLCNKLYSSKLLKNSCLDSSIVNNEDLLRNFVLFQRADKTIFEDFCGYLYWRRENSMSNNNRQKQMWSDILCARKLIVAHATATVKEAAMASWLSALIGAYNSLLAMQDQESVKFRKNCRDMLKKNRNSFFSLSKRECYVAQMIVKMPFIYRILQKMNQITKKYKIQKAARAVTRN